jgi:hypothetical protein
MDDDHLDLHHKIATKKKKKKEKRGKKKKPPMVLCELKKGFITESPT